MKREGSKQGHAAQRADALFDEQYGDTGRRLKKLKQSSLTYLTRAGGIPAKKPSSSPGPAT
jgi:hypothetical protein